MRWQTVLKKLNEAYERAKKASYVEKPMAYSLHKVWLEVDRYEKKKNREKRMKEREVSENERTKRYSGD